MFHNEGYKTLKQVTHRSGRYPMPGSAQGQVGWSYEQPGQVEGAPSNP